MPIPGAPTTRLSSTLCALGWLTTTWALLPMLKAAQSIAARALVWVIVCVAVPTLVPMVAVPPRRVGAVGRVVGATNWAAAARGCRVGRMAGSSRSERSLHLDVETRAVVGGLRLRLVAAAPGERGLE